MMDKRDTPIKRRTLPERLTYLAGLLREDPYSASIANSVALALEVEAEQQAGQARPEVDQRAVDHARKMREAWDKPMGPADEYKDVNGGTEIH